MLFVLRESICRAICRAFACYAFERVRYESQFQLFSFVALMFSFCFIYFLYHSFRIICHFMTPSSLKHSFYIFILFFSLNSCFYQLFRHGFYYCSKIIFLVNLPLVVGLGSPFWLTLKWFPQYLNFSISEIEHNANHSAQSLKNSKRNFVMDILCDRILICL